MRLRYSFGTARTPFRHTVIENWSGASVLDVEIRGCKQLTERPSMNDESFLETRVLRIVRLISQIVR